MESGELAARVLAEALTERPGPARERVLLGYATALAGRHDTYHRIGSRFVDLVDDPRAMDLGLRLLLPRAGPWPGCCVGSPGPPDPCGHLDDERRSLTGKS